jgi:hypothetical protein
VAGPVALSPDRITRSVWVVVDPRDVVTGARVLAPLRVTIRNVSAPVIVSASGLHCFTDLNLPAAKYVIDVQPLRAAASFYFAAQQEFTLVVPPVAGKPLDRNVMVIDLFPRPAYPFAVGTTTLARGQLVKRSNSAVIDAATVTLLRNGTATGRPGRTDERGDFVVFFPPEPAPDSSLGAPPALPPPLTFRLEFVVPGRPPHRIDDQTVAEGGAVSLGVIKFPTL